MNKHRVIIGEKKVRKPVQWLKISAAASRRREQIVKGLAQHNENLVRTCSKIGLGDIRRTLRTALDRGFCVFSGGPYHDNWSWPRVIVSALDKRNRVRLRIWTSCTQKDQLMERDTDGLHGTPILINMVRSVAEEVASHAFTEEVVNRMMELP